MAVIPRSQGVLQGPTTETGLAPQSIAQSQIIPKAIEGVGQDIQSIAGILQAQKAKEEESYNTMQALDFKNKLRNFDNSQKIRLSELPADADVINNEKQAILEERQNFIDTSVGNYGNNKRLQNILKNEYQTSGVDFEFGIDKELSNKKQAYNTNVVYSNISNLKDRFESAKTEDQFAQIIGDLNQTLQFGLATNSITAKDIDKQQESFRKLRKERQADLLNEQAFSRVMNGEILLDSTDKDDRDLINQNYAKLVAKGADPVTSAETLSVATGVIPEQAKRAWSASLFNGDDNQKIDSALRITDLINEKSELGSQFSSNEKALAQAISSRYSAGLSAKKIIEFSEAELRENRGMERTVRNEKFNLEFGKSGKSYVKGLEEIKNDIQGDSGIFFEAEVPIELAGEVRMIARDYYLNEGSNLPDSLERAKKDVLGEWTITKVGERRYQKHAPEVYYGKDSSKWIEKQAIQQVRKATLEELPNIKDQLKLQVVPQTILTGKPSYYLLREDEFGTPNPILGNDNLPLVLKPDFKQTKQYKEQQEDIEKLKLTPEGEADFKQVRGEKRRRRIFKNPQPSTRQLNLMGIRRNES